MWRGLVLFILSLNLGLPEARLRAEPPQKYSETRAYLKSLIERIRPHLPEDAKKLEYEIDIEESWSGPNAFIRLQPDPEKGVNKIEIGLSLLHLVPTEERLIGTIVHELCHGPVRKRLQKSKGSATASLGYEEALVDRETYETLKRMKIDPRSMAEVLEVFDRAYSMETLAKDPLHYPLGFYPAAIDEETVLAVEASAAYFYAGHPDPTMRLQAVQYAYLRDDVMGNVAAKFDSHQIPSNVKDEVRQAFSINAKSKFASKVMDLRQLSILERLRGLIVLATDHSQELIRQKYGEIDGVTYITAEIAQILRYLTDFDSRPKNDASRLHDIDAALKTIDLLHRGLFVFEEDWSLDLQVQIQNVTLEALRTAYIFRNELAPRLSPKVITEKLIELVFDGSELMDKTSEFYALPVGINTFSLFLNQKFMKGADANDLIYLFEEPGGKNPTIFSGGFGWGSLLFSRDGLMLKFSDFMFSERMRPAGLGLNLIVENLKKNKDAFSTFLNHGGKSATRVRVGRGVNELQMRDSGESDRMDDIFEGIDLPDLQKTPNRLSYLQAHPISDSDRIFTEAENVGMNLKSLMEKKRFQGRSSEGTLRLLALYFSNDLVAIQRAAYLEKSKDPFKIIAEIVGFREPAAAYRTKTARTQAVIKLMMSSNWLEDAMEDLMGTGEEEFLETLRKYKSGELKIKSWVDLGAILETDELAELHEHLSYFFQAIQDSNSPRDYEEMLRSPYAQALEELRLALFASQFSTVAVHEGKYDSSGLLMRSVEPLEMLKKMTDRREGSYGILSEHEEAEMFIVHDFIKTLTAYPGQVSSETWTALSGNFKKEFGSQVDHQAVKIEGSTWDKALNDLDARIMRDFQKEGRTSIQDRLEVVKLMARFSSSYSNWSKRVLEIAAEISRIPNGGEKADLAFGALSEFNQLKAELPLNVIDEFSTLLLTEIKDKILNSSGQMRFEIVKRESDRLAEAFKSSPYYFVLDKKIDRLMEDIQATREEARQLARAKTFEGQGWSTRDPYAMQESKEASKRIQLIQFVVTMMGSRSAAENRLVRDFIIHGTSPKNSNPSDFAAALADDMLIESGLHLTRFLEILPEGAIRSLGKNSGIFEIANRPKLKLFLSRTLLDLHHQYRMLPQDQQILIGSMLATAPSSDVPVIDDLNFLRAAVKDFLIQEEKGSKIEILSEEFLKSFDAITRGLLMTKAELENDYLTTSSAADLEKIRAQRISALLKGMGPMGIKIGQLLARSPHITEVMRKELKELEDRADAPSWDQLYELLEKHLTPEEVASSPQIFGVRAGSIKISLFVQFTDAKGKITKKVFSIKRPHVGRLAEKIYDPMQKALIASNERSPDGFFRPFLTLPEEAYEMVVAETDFEKEYQRILEANDAYKAIQKDSDKIDIAVVQPERLSKLSATEECIVMPFIEGIGLEDLPEGKVREKILEEVLRREVRMVRRIILDPAGAEKIRLDTDRHARNFIVEERDGVHSVKHVDFGQWFTFNVGDVSAFARLLMSLGLDLRQENNDFQFTKQVIENAAGASIGGTEFWSDLHQRLENLKKKSVGDKTTASEQAILGLLEVRVSLEEHNRPLAQSVFRLAKAVETWAGVAKPSGGIGVLESILQEELLGALSEGDQVEVFAKVAEGASAAQVADIVAQKAFPNPAKIQIECGAGFRSLKTSQSQP